jgi:Flp pilus assembly protein TadD
VLASLSFLAVRAARRRPELLVGWAWYLTTLVPVIGIIQVGRQASADRYTYIPLIGVFIALVWGVHGLAAGRRALERATAIAAIAVLLVLGVAARAQVATWKDDVALWSKAVASTRHLDNHSSRYALGTALRQRGDTDGAVGEFREAVRLRPDFVAAHYELGLALLERGQPVEALPHFEAVITLQPGHINARRAAAETFMRRSEPERSVVYLQAALRQEPANADVHHQLGLALAKLGRMSEAAGAFAETVRLRPADEAARVNLALALAAAGRKRDAVRELTEVLRNNPGHLAAREALAALERVK